MDSLAAGLARIRAQTPDGVDHHVHVAGGIGAHLIANVQMIQGLPDAGPGQKWVLDRRRLEETTADEG